MQYSVEENAPIMEDLRQTAGTVEGTLRRQLALHGISEYLQMTYVGPSTVLDAKHDNVENHIGLTSDTSPLT